MDTASLLKSLNDHEVTYVIIGATAFPVHGYVRATLDIDIFIAPIPENAEKTLQALRSFGYDVTDLSAGELLTKKILIRQYMVETDIHPYVEGMSFDEVWEEKIASEYQDIPVYFAGLDSLIKMKEAADRPKDREDLKYLRKLRGKRR